MLKSFEGTIIATENLKIFETFLHNFFWLKKFVRHFWYTLYWHAYIILISSITEVWYLIKPFPVFSDRNFEAIFLLAKCKKQKFFFYMDTVQKGIKIVKLYHLEYYSIRTVFSLTLLFYQPQTQVFFISKVFACDLTAPLTCVKL